MTKENWKRCWRLIRIANREAMKAYQDVLIWGTGATRFDPETGECRYVPANEIRLPTSDPNLTVATMGAVPILYGGKCGGGMTA